MKIAFTSIFDINNPNDISGVLYFMSRFLKKQGLDVIHIDNLDETVYKFLKLKSVYYSLSGKKYLRLRDPFFIKKITKQITKKIEITKPDIILSQGSLEVSFLKCSQPIIIWCDGNFADLIDKHPHYKNLSDKTIRDSLMLEQKAYDNASLLLFPSEWAAQSTLEHYKVNPEKVKVVQYGANIENDINVDEINKIISSRKKDLIKILFSGNNWYYKGGDVLIDTVKILISKGFNAEVNIIGCKPELDNVSLKFSKVYGFLRKSVESERKLLEKLFLDSHFFVLPTRYETYGISFCEANAYGLPVFGSNTGGIPSIIRNSVNGFLIEPPAPQFIAEKIIHLFSNYDEYIKLAKSSFIEYNERLNWNVACEKFLKLINSLN